MKRESSTKLTSFIEHIAFSNAQGANQSRIDMLLAVPAVFQ